MFYISFFIAFFPDRFIDKAEGPLLLCASFLAVDLDTPLVGVKPRSLVWNRELFARTPQCLANLF